MEIVFTLSTGTDRHEQTLNTHIKRDREQRLIRVSTGYYPFIVLRDSTGIKIELVNCWTHVERSSILDTPLFRAIRPSQQKSHV